MSVHRCSLVLGALSFLFALSACTVPLTAAGAKVRVIPESQAKTCKFIDVVSTSSLNSANPDPEQGARIFALNRVAQLGGNALWIKTTQTTPSQYAGKKDVSLSGEAYNCP